MQFKFKVNICANTIGVVKSFAVIKNVVIQSFHCMCYQSTSADDKAYNICHEWQASRKVRI